MKNKKIRIILDTNLWISFLITKDLSKIDELLDKDRYILLFSEDSINEFIDVVSRTKLKKYFTKSDIEKLINLFDAYGIIIPIKLQLLICRDEKDNFLLDLAVQGNAAYLITGDKDLLIIKRIENSKIITFKEFVNETT